MSKVTFVSPDIFTVTADMILEEMSRLLVSFAYPKNIHLPENYDDKFRVKVNASDNLSRFIFKLSDKIDIKIIIEVVAAIKEAGWLVSTYHKPSDSSENIETVDRIIKLTVPILNK